MSFSPHRTLIQTRFGDTDALGHVNNASYVVYAETARLEFFKSLGTLVQSLILASLYTDFRRQVAYTDRVHVDSWVEKLGRSSVTVLQTIYANDQVATDIRSVIVHFDYQVNRSAELPPALRAGLERYLRP